MLATEKQLSYLRDLSVRTERMKARYPALVPCWVVYVNPTCRQAGMTSEYASALIRMHLKVQSNVRQTLADRRIAL